MEVHENGLKITKKNKTNTKDVIWSSGTHHVFINDKTVNIYVSEESIPSIFEFLILKEAGLKLGWLKKQNFSLS